MALRVNDIPQNRRITAALTLRLIRGVAHTYFPAMKMMMTETLQAFGREPTFSMLTDREIRCLQLVAEGKRLEDAGNILVLSREDVGNALAAAQIKLEARNLFHAISIGMLLGVIRDTDGTSPK